MSTMTRGALTRRQLLWLALGTAVGTRFPVAANTTKPILVGAIRWDAWYAHRSEVTSAVERTLSPTHYRWRLPFFAKQDGFGHVQMPAITQGLIDLEIAQATYAGLDYWS